MIFSLGCFMLLYLQGAKLESLVRKEEQCLLNM